MVAAEALTLQAYVSSCVSSLESNQMGVIEWDVVYHIYLTGPLVHASRWWRVREASAVARVVGSSAHGDWCQRCQGGQG